MIDVNSATLHSCIFEKRQANQEVSSNIFVYTTVYYDINSIQRIESFESATSGDNTKKSITVQYYYINYKVFVNVVKYKLHRIREKIRSDERKVMFQLMNSDTY